MKKGFTVVELLAVIVVIAILTLVAIPQLITVINTSKDSSKIEAAKNYVKALEDQIVAEQFEKTSLKKGCYIVDEGIINRKGTYADPEDAKIIPDAKGEMPEEGWVIIENDLVIRGQFLFDNRVVNYDGTDANIDKQHDSIVLDALCEED